MSNPSEHPVIAGNQGSVSRAVTRATVALGYLPTSYNRTAHAHWRTVHRGKQRLQRDLELVLLATPGLPRPIPGGRVEVTATEVDRNLVEL